MNISPVKKAADCIGGLFCAPYKLFTLGDFGLYIPILY